MKTRCFPVYGIAFVVFLTAAAPTVSAKEPSASKSAEKPDIAVTEDMGEAAKRQAAKVTEELHEKARSLFEREPLGWNLQTVRYLYTNIISLPQRIPEFTRYVVGEGRVLGLFGSLLVLLFVAAVLYSLLGRARVIQWVERQSQPVSRYIPERYYPYLWSLFKVLASALLPLVFLALFFFVRAMTDYQAAWFRLTGRLLILWAIGALILRFLRELLTENLFQATAEYGKVVFRYARLITIYVLLGAAASWAADLFGVRTDVVNFLRFVVSGSVVTVLFLFFLKKRAFLSFLPELPYRGYVRLLNFIKKFYHPLMIISFLAAALWVLGYRALGTLVLTKLWFTMGALFAVTLFYHSLTAWLERWSQQLDPRDEAAQLLARSLKNFLVYATILSTTVILLNLLGLIDPLARILSFSMFRLGNTQVSPWIIIKAILILLAFVFASRLLQAYLDYKVYPRIGVDPGLGYALNTFFKYLTLAIGFLISIRLVGVDLKFLLVFAGAAGIGIGLGLQNMAANVISGFTIIFGGKIRKGDWIEAGATLGVVTDIYLRATKVRTRDNIEYLIPNSDLISNTIVNYSLSSPFIRIELPVGVSYSADPHEVERILLEAAQQEPLVSNYDRPLVRFVEYGDSSLNFELLVWIDVRSVPRRKIRSALYFAIFDEFKKAGVEIPFPQRDLHIRSKVD
jgi:small-conductance mechanosensitive channel